MSGPVASADAAALTAKQRASRVFSRGESVLMVAVMNERSETTDFS